MFGRQGLDKMKGKEFGGRTRGLDFVKKKTLVLLHWNLLGYSKNEKAVSYNRSTPKSSIVMGFPIINHLF